MCRRRHNSDNGSEFINEHLLRWCETNKVTFTRSRSGNKNDGCYVEQKNWARVRELVGYYRYDVGAHVHARESGPLAEEMMREVFGIHGIPQVVHADRGTSMTSKTVAALLADLEVTRSHSRPKVSNDNPYSEAWFKTLKYAPALPERFGSLTDARAFMADFVAWYNCETCSSWSGTGWQDWGWPFHPVDVTLGTTDPKVSFCGLVRPWGGRPVPIRPTSVA